MNLLASNRANFLKTLWLRHATFSRHFFRTNVKIGIFRLHIQEIGIQNLIILSLESRRGWPYGPSWLCQDGQCPSWSAVHLGPQQLLGTIDRKFPTSEIYVSELFLRGERSMGKYVREMNSYIKLACQNRSQYTALRHSDNIDLPKHLKDDKHLSYIGFYIFLRNIRTQMYGMTPHYKPINPHYKRSGPNQHRR